jgi:hypothetical protein
MFLQKRWHLPTSLHGAKTQKNNAIHHPHRRENLKSHEVRILSLPTWRSYPAVIVAPLSLPLLPSRDLLHASYKETFWTCESKHA